MKFKDLQLLVESNAQKIDVIADRLSELTHIQAKAATERQELRAASIKIANLLALLNSDTNLLRG